MGERYSGLLDMLIFNLCRMKGAEFSDDGLLKAVHLPKRHSTQTTLHPRSSLLSTSRAVTRQSQGILQSRIQVSWTWVLDFEKTRQERGQNATEEKEAKPAACSPWIG